MNREYAQRKKSNIMVSLVKENVVNVTNELDYINIICQKKSYEAMSVI